LAEIKPRSAAKTNLIIKDIMKFVFAALLGFISANSESDQIIDDLI
jgi:hypothetical protein